MISIDHYKHMQHVLKDIVASKRDIEKLQVKTHETAMGKKSVKISNDIDLLCTHLSLREHELHCLMVEAGLALYEEDRYGEKVITLYQGHNEQNVFFRKPTL